MRTAATVSLCLGLLLNVRLLKVSWVQVRHYAVIGFLSQFLYLSCLYVAIQNGLSPGIAAIIAATQPVMTAALSSGSAAERSGGWQWTGLFTGACSFVGLALAWRLQGVWAGRYTAARL